MLVRRDGAVLLQHRDDKPGLRAAGQWGPPGGHCEAGETPIEGALREFREETGYLCNALQLLVELINNNDEGWPPQKLSVFWTFYDGIQEVHCFEGQALAFIHREEAELYKVPAYIMQIWDALVDRIFTENFERCPYS